MHSDHRTSRGQDEWKGREKRGKGRRGKDRVKKGTKDEKRRKRQGERERKQGGGSFCIFKPCCSCSRTFFFWANSRIQRVSASEGLSNCESLPNFYGNPMKSSCDCVAQAGKPRVGRTQPLSRCTSSSEKIRQTGHPSASEGYLLRAQRRICGSPSYPEGCPKVPGKEFRNCIDRT